ncbi:MmcQ/YjbR family DNA-binding protein [Phenylobacterium sp.]|uniref:MmcQ/YjbR family DNA-binding protein n=1 Tax=Phenylobacterium sp. TaxID=1871053 RepID=UPI0025EB6BA6|nr:MmcQ/YjbR family DNA-binding protein [Phenylobacterium sp.]
MLTPDDIRAAALAQPEAYEEPHFDIPSFRVAKKIFCTIHKDHPRIMLKLDPEDQRNLSDGATIEPVSGYWGRNGSTFVWYEKLAPERLAELMRMAWANVAPKRLLK